MYNYTCLWPCMYADYIGDLQLIRELEGVQRRVEDSERQIWSNCSKVFNTV